MVAVLWMTSSGCRVGPDFKKPAPPFLPASYHSAPQEQTQADSLAENQIDTWWAYFDDPVLQGLLIEADTKNLGLREAFFRIVESRARIGTARADWFPQISGKADSTYRNISENASQFVSQNQNGGGFPYHTMGFDSSWEIDLFGRIARNVEAAAADMSASEESLHDLRVTLLADTATTYVQARVLQQRLTIAKQNLALQKQTLEIVRSRQNAGLVGQLDQSEAESNVLVTTASIPPLEQELQTTLYRLAVLLGRTPSGEFTLAEQFAQLPMTIIDNIHPGAPASLLTRRPDIRKAHFDVMAANARIGAAVADRLPQLTIRGDISVEARDISVLYSSGSIVHSVGPGFKWNLLNWGRLKSNIEARKAQHNQTLLRYQATVLKAVQEVESALVEYDRQRVRARALEDVVAVTWRSVEISRMRYEQNLVNFDRVLDAQRSLATAEGNLAAARGDVLFAIIRAYKALGGGWRNPPQCLPLSEPASTETIPPDTIILPITPEGGISLPPSPAPTEGEPNENAGLIETIPTQPTAYPMNGEVPSLDVHRVQPLSPPLTFSCYRPRQIIRLTVNRLCRAIFLRRRGMNCHLSRIR
ncbi:MAG: efflux transporter outer membrane subunit [Pirellulales bacterium]